MGCWLETCALTKTPIRFGEECRQIIFSDKGYLRMKDEYPSIKPNPINNDYPEYFLENIDEIRNGKYDDYGNISGYSKWVNTINSECLFLCKDAIDFIKSHPKTLKTLQYKDSVVKFLKLMSSDDLDDDVKVFHHILSQRIVENRLERMWADFKSQEKDKDSIKIRTEIDMEIINMSMVSDEKIELLTLCSIAYRSRIPLVQALQGSQGYDFEEAKRINCLTSKILQKALQKA
jgi:hypothetical protein